MPPGRSDRVRQRREGPATRVGIELRERMYRERRRAWNIGSGWRSTGRGRKGARKIEAPRARLDPLAFAVWAREKGAVAPAPQAPPPPRGTGAATAPPR